MFARNRTLPRVALTTEQGELAWTDESLLEWLARRVSDPKPVLDGLAAGRPHHELPGLSAADRVLVRRAWEIPADEQLSMQASAQRCVDGAISKTVQLDAADPPTPAALVAWIQRARDLDCKGVAFYCRAETTAARIDLRAACPSCAENRS